MDNETNVCHLVALWSFADLKHFRVLRDRAFQGGIPVGGGAYLDGGPVGPDELVLTLRGDPDWATVVVRASALDTEIEVRSRGLQPVAGRISAGDTAAFGSLLERVCTAVDAVLYG